jgi:hypothetical protein
MTHLERVHGKEQNRRTVADERSGENLERKKNIVGDRNITRCGWPIWMIIMTLELTN